jgi:prepilin-type N-terminal cleavage/methylation domain-containing protein
MIRRLIINIHFKKQIKKQIISGFTLAEVLITLLIIGVVASMVIPNIINDSQDAEIKTAWKKSYSDISQATMKMISDNGGSLVNICATNDHTCFKNFYNTYFPYIKTCVNAARDGCWANVFYSPDGTKVTSWGTSTGAILNDGTFFMPTYYDSNCEYNVFGGVPRCGDIRVDVNGMKGPNKLGKDIFSIWILKSSLKPRGSMDDYTNDCTVNGGWGCAAKFLYQ